MFNWLYRKYTDESGDLNRRKTRMHVDFINVGVGKDFMSRLQAVPLGSLTHMLFEVGM